MSNTQPASGPTGIPEVVLMNLKDGKAFFSLTSQEARKAMDLIKLLRKGGEMPGQIEHRQFMIQLHEKGLISTKKLLESFDIDYDEEAAKIVFERKQTENEILPQYGIIQQGETIQRVMIDKNGQTVPLGGLTMDGNNLEGVALPDPRAEELAHWQKEFDTIKGELRKISNDLNADLKGCPESEIQMSKEKFKVFLNPLL